MKVIDTPVISITDGVWQRSYMGLAEGLYDRSVIAGGRRAAVSAYQADCIVCHFDVQLRP